MATEKNYKQLMRELNRKKNEMQQLESLMRKTQKGPAQTPGTGLSKGQRQRRNRAQKKVEMLPRGLPVGPSSSSGLPRGLPSSSVMQTTTTTVRNDEVVRNIHSSDLFRIETIPINPGQATTFPWLAAIAKNWEKYHFKRLHFYFRSTVSGFADAGRQGKVLLSIDMDSSDPPPVNAVMMEACKPSDYRLPSEGFSIIPNLSLMQPDELFVRSGPLPGSADIKTYDCGQLHIATEGIGAIDSIVGQLRVAYEVVLGVPVLESESTRPPNFRTTTSYGEMTNQTASSGLVVSYAGSEITQNPWGLSATPSGELQLPAGNYQVSLMSNIIANSPYQLGKLVLAPRFSSSSGSTVSDSTFFVQEGASAGVEQATLVWTGLFRTDGSLNSSDFLSWDLNSLGFGSADYGVQTYLTVTSL